MVIEYDQYPPDLELLDYHKQLSLPNSQYLLC